MKPCPYCSDIDGIKVWPDGAIECTSCGREDPDIYLSLLLGMWFHTRDLVGKPTRAEVELELAGTPRVYRERVIAMLGDRNQLALPNLELAA